jgi:hypothetical protein
MFRYGFSKKLLSTRVDGVFVSSQKIDEQFYWQLSERYKPLDFKKGMIAIYYGKTLYDRVQIFRFGTNLDKGEAQQIVKLIHEKLPQYIYSKSKNMG